MRNIRFYLIGLFCFLSMVYGKSQIVAPYSNYSEIAEYGIDSLYFFAPGNDSTFIMADTTGTLPDSVKWEFFEPVTGYKPLAQSDYKLFTNPTFIGKGYKLTAYRNGNPTITRCWVFSYHFDCKILTKDKFDTLLTSAYADECDLYGPIQVKIVSDSIVYYNPNSKERIDYTVTFNAKWDKDIKDDLERGNVVFVGYSGGNRLYNIVNAYWEDMWYWITVTDKLGTSQTDSVFVRSITPHAEFTATYINLDNSYYAGEDDNYYFFYGNDVQKNNRSAPASYSFTNSSKNATEYLWNFGDTLTSNQPDSILHIYYRWKEKYDVTLIATHIVEWSGKKCTDTVPNTDSIYVTEPKLEAPNAFAVNSDKYPAWRFYDVSITDFEIAIYNRYGVRVHHFKGNIRDWDGWDGRIGNTNNYASTGVYYYVVKNLFAVPYYNPNENTWGSRKKSTDSGQTGGTGDNPPPTSDNTEYRGFFHLFNNQE
jgi:hypothetical protein